MVDEQHKNIVSAINELEELISRREAGEDIDLSPIMDKLRDYSFGHLVDEEALLKESGYGQYHEHCHLHQAYRHKIVEMTLKAPHLRRLDDAIEMHNFLKGWWDHHILVEDKKFVDNVKVH